MDRYVNMDLVICVEATSNMNSISKQVNDLINTLIARIGDRTEECDLEMDQFRVKLIFFRDYACCSEPMVESKFFVLPEEYDSLQLFVGSVEYKGGYGWCNALEAIALALKSDWVPKTCRERHIIFLISNGKVRPLGGHQMLLSNYPKDMPADIAELGARWHGINQSSSGTFEPLCGRLFALAPYIEPWIDLQAWHRYWHEISEFMDLDDMDWILENVFALLFGS